MMNDSRTLVEHFFRHEYGRLVAVLTRSLGVHHFELVEDVVQSTLHNAILVWGQKGIPENPSAWLYSASRNRAIDSLRRAQIENRLLRSETLAVDPSVVELPPGQLDGEIVDEPLRLFCLCCHPQIPLESSIAFALKNISGFSIDEVAAALLISKSNAEKRVTRARAKLRELGTELTEIDSTALESRLDALHACIYLLFNEGYASASVHASIRKDVCEEAIRLARMLCRSTRIAIPSTAALLALLLMHSARFDARVGSDGSIVLLEDQDRSLWDWDRIREAMFWMAKSADGSQLSRYHVEVAIAWEHCRAKSFHDIDWQSIAEHYAVLLAIQPSPMVQLNLAIALSYSSSLDSGLTQLVQITAQDRARIRPWWDCAIADVYYRQGNLEHAISHWQDGIRLATNEDQRDLMARRLQKAEKEKNTL